MKSFIFFFLLSVSPAFSGEFIQLKNETAPPKGAIGLCGKYSWACKNTEGFRSDEDIVKRTNNKINRGRPIEDIDQYGVYEHWSTMTSIGGDCEDYALSKMKTLIDVGVDSNSLFMAVVLVRKRNPHAVLIWRTEKGDFVLDNLTNRIKPWKKTGYFFIAVQNPNDKTKWNYVME